MKDVMPQMKLLPYRYKRHGLWVLIIGIPFMTLITFALITVGLIPKSDAFFDEWSKPIIYYPIIIGLALLNFSEEREEDEMVQHLRYQSFMLGVFYLIVGLLMLPLFTNVVRLLEGRAVGMPDVGGMWGALVLLLFYTYASFRYKLHQIRKALETDAE
ncbi:hypothetical protein [Pontibacter ramchanderi]|uniref:Uncharacterized protein n=1 Tax=Pontibacter ramchanderi TaxID=1179743 RepID=A0A2N3U773_9BACT|nr:hypothetical protein [Pontibacter ramchanderi]PKV62584.1 hypothetical protein BD749_3787 [Pontibacter ramchanderi]